MPGNSMRSPEGATRARVVAFRVKDTTTDSPGPRCTRWYPNSLQDHGHRVEGGVHSAGSLVGEPKSSRGRAVLGRCMRMCMCLCLCMCMCLCLCKCMCMCLCMCMCMRMRVAHNAVRQHPGVQHDHTAHREPRHVLLDGDGVTGAQPNDGGPGGHKVCLGYLR